MYASRSQIVLVVDDNQVNRTLLVRQLERLGYRASAVASGAEALEAMAAHPYALVLMDRVMPEMDGLETTRRIRQEDAGSGRRTPIVALTASASESDREACLAAGIDEVLTKPLSFETLGSLLRRCLGAGMDPVPPERLADNVPDELVRIYLDELVARVLAIHGAIETGDTDGLALAAHTLKSTSALIGAVALAEFCGELEAVGRSGRIDGGAVGRLLPSLDDESERIRGVLEASLAAGASVEPV